MNAIAIRAPLETKERWRYRLIATAAALSLGTGIYMIQRMPAAATLEAGEEDTISATPTQTMALYNLRAAPALQYDGALGAGLRISVSNARLTPAARKNFAALGLQLPNVRGGAIRWQGRPAADGRIAIRVKNGRQAPDAGMMLRATGSGRIPELNIRAVQTVLSVQVEIAAQGADTGAAELDFAGTPIADPALAFTPLEIEITPGESMNLTFDSENALEESSFRLGALLESGGTATALSLGRIEVGRLASNDAHPQLRSVIRGVCAAPSGKLLLTHLYPRPDECQLGESLTDDHLFANDIQVAPRKIDVALEGNGFVLSNGRAKPAAFWTALMANPLIAALLGGLVFTIARPLWRLWTGRDL